MNYRAQTLIIISIILLLLSTTLSTTTSIHPIFSKKNITTTHHEENIHGRRFLWATPETTPPKHGYPILFLLHGATQYAETWFYEGKGGLKASFIWGKRQTEFTQLALEQGFFIIAPDSKRHGLLGPKAWDSRTPDINQSDDLRFIINIIHWVQNTSMPLNKTQIFCIGFSSGGFMTSRIGLTLGKYFQAIAIHSGGNADSFNITKHGHEYDCITPLEFPPDYPPTLIIHGTQDRLVPAKCATFLYDQLQNTNITSYLLLNPYGHHIWQSIFNTQILKWFTYGYHAPSPPEQPTTGPGSSNYTHNAIHTYHAGHGVDEYWIFSPDDPQPNTAPVIVFNHGWGAMYPQIYKAWINHIVQRGNIVIYPRYQKFFVFGYKRFVDNAINAVANAISYLENNSEITPDLDRFAITGHSLGGGITSYMAARAQSAGLPTPKAIMPVQPFTPYGPPANLSLIANTTYMLVIVGANDSVVGNKSARHIYYNSTNIPDIQKEYIIQITDTYGFPPLVADHGAPTCQYNNSFLDVNAMDYYSTWKLFDALTDYAFYGFNKQYCFGNTEEQRFMGLWSDGTSVAELEITQSP